MGYDDDEPEGWRQAAARAGILFLLLLSPAGAPVVGFGLAATCDIDWEVIDWEVDPRCLVPTPLLFYFLANAFLPWVVAGPILSSLWLLLSLGLVLRCLYFAPVAIWRAATERL